MAKRSRGPRAASAVLRVGYGRGFVVRSPAHGSVVVTAAHCLPRWPEPYGAPGPEERTFPKLDPEDRTFPRLLAALGQENAVWAECLFVDPIADLAILGEPDSQELSDEWSAFSALLAPVRPLRIRAPRAGSAWLLGLDGGWQDWPMEIDPQSGRAYLLAEVDNGQSGSPVIQNGSAVGVVSTSLVKVAPTDAGELMYCPWLVFDLPAWMLRAPRSRTVMESRKEG